MGDCGSRLPTASASSIRVTCHSMRCRRRYTSSRSSPIARRYAVPSGADGRLALPALVRDLQIDYTALSLVAPEKMRFRYKLEGCDRDWQDVGSRRQAFYTDLAPGNYRFRVIAANNSGVWNEAGAIARFLDRAGLLPDHAGFWRSRWPRSSRWSGAPIASASASSRSTSGRSARSTNG